MYNKYYQAVTVPCINKDFHSHPKPIIKTGKLLLLGGVDVQYKKLSKKRNDGSSPWKVRKI
jgi:hypothetical protein